MFIGRPVLNKTVMIREKNDNNTPFSTFDIYTISHIVVYKSYIENKRHNICGVTSTKIT